MAVHPVTLSNLKRVKNSIIGNPSAKLALARDEHFVQTLVDCLNNPPPPLEDEPQALADDIRIQAAHVVSSLSYGSKHALHTLLAVNAPEAFYHAISNFQPSDSFALRAAFARGLRSLVVAVADIVGPSQWGLKDEAGEMRNEAKAALDYLFQLEYLDSYLPLLLPPPSPSVAVQHLDMITSIAQLIASAVRTESHRTAITNWTPHSERNQEVKGKRGWEREKKKMGTLGGWVTKCLVGLLTSRNAKLLEATLGALAALAKDNPDVATVLAKIPTDRDTLSPLASIVSLTKSRSTTIQLTASLCATHIIRANQSPNSHSHAHTPYPHISSSSSTIDPSYALTVMHVVNRVICSLDEPSILRTKACFILCYLVADDKAMCEIAVSRGSLDKLADLVKSVTNVEEGSREWEDDEPESVSVLREAALTTISTLALFSDDIRRSITDTHLLLPIIASSVSSRHVGTRYAACQCIRTLSRTVSVLRTNLVDSGVGMKVFEVVIKKTDEGGEQEQDDRRVIAAALGGLCNLVTDFSPLREPLLEQGLIPRLVELLGSGDPTLRLSSMWCMKNLLRNSSLETKNRVVGPLGWKGLEGLLLDSDAAVQEQAWAVVRNLTGDELAAELVVSNLNVSTLQSLLVVALASTSDDVVLQSACVVANLSNGAESHQELILHHPPLLSSLRKILVEGKPESRRPAMACILELARSNRKAATKVLRDAGIVSTLRHLGEWNGGGVVGLGGSPGGPGGGRHGPGVGGVKTEDAEVIDQAKIAYDWLEHDVAF